MKYTELALEKTYWDKYKIKKTYPYISSNKFCDILIIGGGICGAIAAYYQVKRGNKVIIVDKGIMGFGDTKKCLGIIKKNISITDYYKTKNNRVNYKIKKLYEEAYESFEKIMADLESCDILKDDVKRIAFEKKDLIYYSDKVNSKFKVKKDYEKIINIYKEDDINYIENHKYINLKAGIKENNSVITFNPYEFTKTLLRYLSEIKNVEIYENTNIKNITNIEEKVEAIDKNKFKIVAKKIIIATGTENIKNIKDYSICEIRKSYNIITEPLEDLEIEETRFVAKSIIDPYEYITFTENNEILINAQDSLETSSNENIYFAKGKYIKLFKLLDEIFILPKELKINNCYVSTYLKTKDDLPIIDELEDTLNTYILLPSGKCNLNFILMGAKMLEDISRDCYTKDMNLFRINR